MQPRKIESPKISSSHGLLFILIKPGLLLINRKRFLEATYTYRIKIYFLHALKLLKVRMYQRYGRLSKSGPSQ